MGTILEGLPNHRLVVASEWMSRDYRRYWTLSLPGRDKVQYLGHFFTSPLPC